jgi:membrane fusion protein, macrolide-specific efflux system
MFNKKLRIITIAAVVIIAAGLILVRIVKNGASGDVEKEIKPVIGSIKTFISTTGTVLPKNRLEVKPPVNGRVEDILVKEGEVVKTGKILAWMSSTDRAALLDAARGKGQESLQYWEETYKPIPLLAPINGEVIVAKTQPGQTVTTADAVVVLSDHLIVRAQVDETDIGKIKPDNKAIITLDAYPDDKINASVEHIYYESQTVNNVTIYQVDLLPDQVPSFFRSGMNATVDFVEKDRSNILIIPSEAAHKDKTGDYVLIKNGNEKNPVRISVKLGITDDKNVEVISGVSIDDTIVVNSKKYALPQATVGTNPFMPSRRR